MVVREVSVIFDSEFTNMQNHLRMRSNLDYDSLTEALWGWRTDTVPRITTAEKRVRGKRCNESGSMLFNRCTVRNEDL